jgi:hypothetical protein
VIKRDRLPDLLKFKCGIRLLIVEEYFRKKKYKGNYGFYNGEVGENEYEILIDKKLNEREKVITIIHEIEHFLTDIGESLRDPEDLDYIAEYIYDLVKNSTKAARPLKGERK